MNKNIRIGIKIFLVIFLGSLVYNVFKLVWTSIHEGSIIKHRPNKEYCSLFSDSVIARSRDFRTYYNKDVPPVSYFEYRGNNIFVCRLKADLSKLSEQINVSFVASDKSSGEVYNSFSFTNLEFNFISGHQIKASVIYIGMEGDSVSELIKNDSIVSYSMFLRKFSLSYDSTNDPVDIFIDRPNVIDNKSLSSNMVFVRRNNAVYLMFMYTDYVVPIRKEDMLIHLLK